MKTLTEGAELTLRLGSILSKEQTLPGKEEYLRHFLEVARSRGDIRKCRKEWWTKWVNERFENRRFHNPMVALWERDFLSKEDPGLLGDPAIQAQYQKPPKEEKKPVKAGPTWLDRKNSPFPMYTRIETRAGSLIEKVLNDAEKELDNADDEVATKDRLAAKRYALAASKVALEAANKEKHLKLKSNEETRSQASFLADMIAKVRAGEISEDDIIGITVPQTDGGEA
jgi:hypothetical protein